MVMLGRWVVLGATVWVLMACVTIHIYFPAAAAEEAARAIVRDVLETTPAESGGNSFLMPEAEPAKWNSQLASPAPHEGWKMSWLDRLIPAAQAQSALDLRVETATTRRLQAAMRTRNAELASHLRSGSIGYGIDGLVVVRDLSAVALRDRSAVQQAVNEENADRRALYREIARANDRPDWEADIQRTFARIWIEEAPSGYWVEVSPGTWRQK